LQVFKGGYCGSHYRQFVQGEEVKSKPAGGAGDRKEMPDEGKLRTIFRALDLNGDGTLDAAELQTAFAKSGQKPSLAEVASMIAEYDSSGNKSIDFKDFTTMVQRVSSGAVPSSTGLPSLITGAWEDFIIAVNKKPEKPQPKKIGGKGGGEAQPEAPQGQKYVIKKKGPMKVVYKNLPTKKDFKDLP